MMSEYEVRKQMCDIGERVYARGMVAANDGNFSVKLNSNEILCTPTGVSKGFMTPSMICKVDAKGNVISTDGKHQPSSEVKMHLRVYEERPDVNAVVHAHPMYATAHAIAGIPLTKQIMPESTIFLGEIPIAKYGLPSTPEIPDSLEPFLQTHDAVLLENHGALAWGSDLMTAYFKLEGLEFYAQLCYTTEMLGGAKELPEYEVERLVDLRRGMDATGKHPCIEVEGACGITGQTGQASQPAKQAAPAPAAEAESDDLDIAALTAEITRKVMEHLQNK